MLSRSRISSQNIIVWVLAPHVESTDSTINYYYDFSENEKEFSRAFTELNIQWKWQYATLENYKQVIDAIALDADGKTPVVFNLCDGDEINGAPGISVIKYLRKKKLVFTGAEELFYDLTTSKIPMKKAFDTAGVANASWFAVDSKTFKLNGQFREIPKPVIIKPAVSGGSMGLGIRNVVSNERQFKKVLGELYKGCHGWEFGFGGFVAESFIKGREFTSFVIGSYNDPDNIILYPPVERVFHSELPEEEQFLSFDRLWEFYEGEKPVGNHEDFFNYFPVEKALANDINDLSKAAYIAVAGTGYGRIDIRRDKEGKLFVLEVNAQCGLSEDENFTSIGAILRLANRSFAAMVALILQDAFGRYGKRRPARQLSRV